MKTYIIVYQLRDYSNVNYMPFYDAIKTNYPNRWNHFVEDGWFVKTDDTAEQIYDKIRPFMQKTDSLFVSEITDDFKGWLAVSVWPWLRDKEDGKE